MDGANIQHLLAMILYMLAVIAIGIVFARRANKDAESYFLGGRSLGPWVTAFSAEASDMSGYLLMGLPGLAYWTGLADAGWTCIGLAIGTYLNFLIVSKRLDLHRPCPRYLPELPHHLPPSAAVQHRGRRLHRA